MERKHNQSRLPPPSWEHSSMSSDRVLDYLTEELVAEKNIVRVSYRIRLIPRLWCHSHALLGYVSLLEYRAWNSRQRGQKVCSILLRHQTYDNLPSANLPSTTRSMLVLSMPPARPISLAASHAYRIWTACETQKRWP